MARHCAGIAVAMRMGMAIMWDPPASSESLDPTSAEIAWRMWLMQTLAASAAEEAKLREAEARGEGTAEDSQGPESPPAVER